VHRFAEQADRLIDQILYQRDPAQRVGNRVEFGANSQARFV
jgi:hypothetical protein